MIRKILNGAHLVSLDKIIQWSELDGHISESVSQHSYKVAIFAAVLVEELFPIGTTYPEGSLLLKYECVVSALFHDWDEHYIKRDLSHELKYNLYNGKKIREAVDDYALNAASVDLDETSEASEFILSRIFEKKPLVKNIVKVCDWLALLHHLSREVKMGNRTMDGYITYCSQSLLISIEMLQGLLEDTACNINPINDLINYAKQKLL